MLMKATGIERMFSREAMDQPLPTPDSKLRTFGAIKGAFERTCSDIVFDAAFAKRLILWQIGFVNKNDDHIAFFGGVLTGVEIVRMTPSDMNTFFTDIVRVNELEVEEEIHALPIIKPHRKISGDVFNHVCLWVVHGFLTTKLIPPKEARRAALAAALILNYRYLTSLLSWYYKTPASKEYAQAAYARLTKRSAIKQFGSWQALLEHRCEDLLPPNGLHAKTTVDYYDDHKIVYALNDHQNRIRSMMIHLMSELYDAKAAGDKIKATSGTVEMDEGSFIKDNTKTLGTYEQYLFSTMVDENTFIKPELLNIVKDVMFTAPPHLTREVLSWMVKHYKTKKGEGIDKLVTAVMAHSFGYLDGNRNTIAKHNAVGDLLQRLKGAYASSRSRDPKLFELRDLITDVVEKAIPTRNASVLSAVKTAVMLYIVLRAFTMQHYSRS